MKKFTVFAGLSLLCIGLLPSCSSDPEYDTSVKVGTWEGGFQYDSEGVWTKNNDSGYLTIEGYEFSHILDSYGMVYGFTPSRVSDTSKHTPLYSFPYASASGGGLSGKGSQYLVGYWAEFLEGSNSGFDDRTCRIYAEDGDEFEPQSVMVCNNTYLEYAALDGTDFSPKFQPGDYVTLIAHGVHLDGTESQAQFYLINIESENIAQGIITSWKKFDLSSLGKCTGIYFTMGASERLSDPNYGLNIPTYFCIDQLVVKE